jgi:glycosyltransferase involved in cell wall biosynthesis
MGFDVLLVGRKLPDSSVLKQREYATKQMKLLFKKGPLFYGEYNLRLFLFLLFSKSEILLSNDLDTLLANYLVSKLRNKKLVFDSHEYFTEVPELVNRPRVQKIWKAIEKRIIPKLKFAYTVCDSIAELYFSDYGIKFEVIRNIPEKWEKFDIPEEKKIKTLKKIIIYQGAVNIGRGLPQVISAMQFLEDSLLVIVGTGDIINEVKNQVIKLKLEKKVLFVGRVPTGEVKYYTAQASLGLSIEEDMGLNYRFALTNKFFDYIQANVPVLVSNLPEMAKLVNQYQIGTIINSFEPEILANHLNEALFNEELKKGWETTLKKAAEELTWEKEEKVLWKIFKPFTD